MRRPIRHALLALLSVIAVGTCGYMLIEGWVFLDALWMVIITLTTIGFGEIHPLSVTGRWFTLGLIVSGVSIGTWTLTHLTQDILDGELGAWLRFARRKRTMDRLSGHFVVAGYGRLGRTVVEELRAGNVPVAVIEKEEASIRELEALGIPAMVGDASDDEILRAVGIERAKALAIAVSSSAEAVYATLSARALNANLNIVTRVTDPVHALKAIRAGATSVVNPHVMGGWRMAQGLLRPHASSFLDIATLASEQDIQLEELVVENARAVGRLESLDVGSGQGVLIAAVRRLDGTMLAIPTADTAIVAGDCIIALGRPAAIKRLAARVAR